jgi:hypothetical protein
MQDAYDAMVMRLARILCANTNVATRESPEPVYDEPDDLVWLDSPNGPVLAARWRLYEERAHLAQRLPDLALIEKLASSLMF